MKRYGNLYKEVCSINNLRLAHKNASKGKGWYQEVKEINKDPDKYLKRLQRQLKRKTYHTSEYQTFLKTDGQKEREIYKLPYFPDRICHWAILQVIEPIIINNLILDTYSAIPNRGIHFGMKRVLKDIDKDPAGCQYCLKLDMKKYYPSINHEILKQKYARLIKDKDLLWLINEIIDSTEGDTGVPIGNYLSQYSGNLYLSSFDHWVREVKGFKHYYRYMDDIVILSDSKLKLHKLLNEICVYLRDKLKLTIKDNWQIFPTFTRGLDFLGYRFFKNYKLLRKFTTQNLKKKMTNISKKIENGGQLNYSEWCSINSYNGWLKHCNSFNLRQKYVQPLIKYTQEYYETNIKGA
jgi:hypothetical protein